jgi:hypothetical protein
MLKAGLKTTGSLQPAADRRLASHLPSFCIPPKQWGGPSVAKPLDFLLEGLKNWFVWIGWTKARDAVIELLADFFVSVSVWLLYALFERIATHLIENPEIRALADSIHTAAALATFASLAGIGLLRFIAEALDDKHS